MAGVVQAERGVVVQSHSGAAFFCRLLEQCAEPGERTRPDVLVTGCGAGHEAALIHQRLAARVQAIDLQLDCCQAYDGWPDLDFRQASVTDLPFSERSFDAVFYHHVIEHVDDPPRSLAEIARVLRPGGWLFIGTPNRHRLVSAVGSHPQRDWESTWANKLQENVQDWRDRLRGRFRNEYGAHAGFSRGELDRMLAEHFQHRRWLTQDYLRFKYAGHRLRALVRLATAAHLLRWTAPSIYALCRTARECRNCSVER